MANKSNLFLIILILILLGLLAWAFFNGKKHKKKLSELESRIEKTQDENNFLDSLSLADEAYILDMDYKKAKNIYTKLGANAGAERKKLLQKRIEKLDNTIEAKKSDVPTELESELKNKASEIDRLKERIDRIRRKYGNETDSLSNKLNTLMKESRKKEKQLERKEKIQVITFNSSKGNKIHYLGEVENGKANGGGVGIWTTGSIYRGDWKDNQRHGKGTFEWADGEKYEGDYKQGLRDGQGIYHWPSGERYEGAWKDDRRNGFGKLFDKNGNIRYEGQWKDDKPVDK